MTDVAVRVGDVVHTARSVTTVAGNELLRTSCGMFPPIYQLLPGKSRVTCEDCLEYEQQRIEEAADRSIVAAELRPGGCLYRGG